MNTNEITEVERVFHIASEVKQHPYFVVRAAVDYRWHFDYGDRTAEKTSNRNPPSPLTERSEVITIDGVLGLYNSKKQQITIFSKGIRRVADILQVSSFDLTQIVRLHEWAHALLHMGLDEEDGPTSLPRNKQLRAELAARNTIWFDSLDPVLHEKLAQLITREGLRWLKRNASLPESIAAIDRIETVFQQLTRRSPSAYQIHKYQDVPRSRIVDSIRLLKSGGLVGAEAWETVLTW